MIYAVYEKSASDFKKTVFVKEGFTPLALVFGPLWFIYHKMFFSGVIFFTINGFVHYISLEHDLRLLTLSLIVNVFCGIIANDLLQSRLVRSGYKFISTVVAHDETGAHVKFCGALDDQELFLSNR